MYKIEEKCTPTRVDEKKRLKLFSAFQMMQDCDDLWIDSEPESSCSLMPIEDCHERYSCCRHTFGSKHSMNAYSSQGCP